MYLRIIRIGKREETSRFEISFETTHQFLGFVFNFHQWKWIDSKFGHSTRTETCYYGIVTCLNVFYCEIRIVITPFKKTIKK